MIDELHCAEDARDLGRWNTIRGIFYANLSPFFRPTLFWPFKVNNPPQSSIIPHVMCKVIEHRTRLYIATPNIALTGEAPMLAIHPVIGPDDCMCCTSRVAEGLMLIIASLPSP